MVGDQEVSQRCRITNLEEANHNLRWSLRPLMATTGGKHLKDVVTSQVTVTTVLV